MHDWFGVTFLKMCPRLVFYPELEVAIKSTLESGRAVVFAVNTQLDRRHRRND